MRKISLLLIVLILLSSLFGCANKNSSSNYLESSKISEVNVDLKQDDGSSAKGTKAIFYVNSENIIYGFEISGHTGYAENGYDLVCAAISTLVYNAINSLILFTDDKVVKDLKDDSYAKLILPDLKNGKGSREAIFTMKSTAASMKDIEDTYGSEFLKVICKKD